jgi:diguanylate cyclase (GGDEF)-like protein/PAS domain S-box-containing protein
MEGAVSLVSRNDDDKPLADERQAARRLEGLARLSPSFLYVLEFTSKRPLWSNRSLAEALGYSPEQIRSQGERLLPSITHPHDLTVVVDRWSELEALPDGAHIEYLRRLRDAAGHYRWFSTREAVLTRDDAGRPTEILGITSDVTAEKESERRLDELNPFDATTGLPNQRAVRERLDLLFAEGVRGRAFAVVMVDIDHWKRMVDTHGTVPAERALAAAATLLRGNIRRTDLVGRWGEDEFCVLLPDIKPAAATALAEKLRRSLGHIADPCPLTATFGVCCYDASTPNPAALLDAAKRAVARGKQTGRNRVELASA